MLVFFFFSFFFVCIRQFKYTTCIFVESFDMDRYILSSVSCKKATITTGFCFKV